MVSLETPVCNFGWKAPDFTLEGVDGNTYSLKDIMGANGAVVMFICNHCPYVKAILDRLVGDARYLQDRGIGVIAIMSNDPSDYPEDSFENMETVARTNDFTFPYVIDPSQQIARAYGAVCTPDFFGFDKTAGLQYRGRLDSSRKDPGPADARRDLIEAMKQVIDSGQGPLDQIPSMGCSIKWINENQ